MEPSVPNPQPPLPRRTLPSSEAAKALLVHADRWWKAEESNAARLASRANLALSVLTATLGFKLVAISREIETVRLANGFVQALYWSFTVLAGFYLCKALLRLIAPQFQPPQDDKPQAACSLLAVNPKIQQTPLDFAEEAMFMEVWANTNAAAANLGVRNSNREKRIHHAQVLLMLGILFVFCSMGIWAISAYGANPKAPESVQLPTGGSQP